MNTTNNPEHILYLTYDGIADPLGQSQILPYLNGLAALVYRFKLISFEKSEEFDSVRQSMEPNITWHTLKYHKKPLIFSTIYDVWILWKHAKMLIHQDKSITIVHCRSYITSLIGLELKRRYSVKFIFDMR